MRNERTVKGAYSGDFEESDLMKDELNWMPGPTPNIYVRDAQKKGGIDLSGKLDPKFFDWRNGPVSDRSPLKKGR